MYFPIDDPAGHLNPFVCPSRRLHGGQLPQRRAELCGIAVDGNLFEARCRARENPHLALGHPERFREQLRHRAIGLAAVSDGADAHLDRGTAVGERFNSVDIVAATAWGYAQCDTDALDGIAPRIHWASMPAIRIRWDRCNR